MTSLSPISCRICNSFCHYNSTDFAYTWTALVTVTGLVQTHMVTVLLRGKQEAVSGR